MRTYLSKIFTAACLACVFATHAQASLMLPEPGLSPYSLQYDDFYSYSVKILNNENYFGDSTEWKNAIKGGTGQLELLILAKNNGSQNDGITDPLHNPSNSKSSTYSGTWTENLVTLLNYIKTGTPVFSFDFSEPGSDTPIALYVSAYMTITDKNTGEVIDGAEWDFDTLDNSVYDVAAKAGVPAALEVTGSGWIDFLVYAPTMKLYDYIGNPYADNNYLFNIHVDFAGVEAGGEEIAITGGIFLPYTPVPEPASLALLGLGIPAVFFFGRKLRK